MNANERSPTISLTAAQIDLASRGTFVRVDVGFWTRAKDGTQFRSAFVARTRSAGGGEPRWVAYANVCRHHPIELDVPDPTIDRATGLRIALLAQDGVGLLCASHGAVYRPADGFCTTGPCSGQKLAAIDVIEEESGAVALALPPSPGSRSPEAVGIAGSRKVT